MLTFCFFIFQPTDSRIADMHHLRCRESSVYRSEKTHQWVLQIGKGIGGKKIFNYNQWFTRDDLQSFRVYEILFHDVVTFVLKRYLLVYIHSWPTHLFSSLLVNEHAYVFSRTLIHIDVAQPKNKMWRPEDLATVGELLLDISANLVQT